MPAIAHYIHVLNPVMSMKINLKGIAIGDAYSDPESAGVSFFLSTLPFKEIKYPLPKWRLLFPNLIKGNTVAQLTF